MGVVNVTPDSFSDGGDHFALAAAIAGGRRLASEGADILDIGGESTRPGATPVDEATERARVLPVIEALAGNGPLLSIDTYKASVADAAVLAGVRIVNDVTGLRRDPAIANVAAAHDAALVIGHWEPDTRHEASALLDAILRFFDASIRMARAAGVADRRMILDPGIGFGKNTTEENVAVLAGLDRLVALGYPVLAGASRKRFIGALTGRQPKERLAGSLAAHILAATRGASIIRAHDVAAHREGLAVADAILAADTPKTTGEPWPTAS
ncbi:dihydropteroate synthase [Kaistia soli DSM 19436]|uniref:dihydropteroate synthase n=2 Tax=Kaistia TaxID=166953 RepID=A0A1M5H2I9_9HYPH|nr:dihydropteroate synthase [Kaistia soli DSM 19436]